MPDQPYSRRDFLLRISMAGAMVPVIAACNGDRPPSPPGDDLVEQPPPVGDPPDTPPDPEIVSADCPGYEELTSEDLATREGLSYTDRTPETGQYCHTCEFVTEGEQFGACMGCQLFAGPVAPEGWCAAWAEARA